MISSTIQYRRYLSFFDYYCKNKLYFLKKYFSFVRIQYVIYINKYWFYLKFGHTRVHFLRPCPSTVLSLRSWIPRCVLILSSKGGMRGNPCHPNLRWEESKMAKWAEINFAVKDFPRHPAVSYTDYHAGHVRLTWMRIPLPQANFLIIIVFPWHVCDFYLILNSK